MTTLNHNSCVGYGNLDTYSQKDYWEYNFPIQRKDVIFVYMLDNRIMKENLFTLFRKVDDVSESIEILKD